MGCFLSLVNITLSNSHSSLLHYQSSPKSNHDFSIQWSPSKSPASVCVVRSSFSINSARPALLAKPFSCLEFLQHHSSCLAKSPAPWEHAGQHYTTWYYWVLQLSCDLKTISPLVAEDFSTWFTNCLSHYYPHDHSLWVQHPQRCSIQWCGLFSSWTPSFPTIFPLIDLRHTFHHQTPDLITASKVSTSKVQWL